MIVITFIAIPGTVITMPRKMISTEGVALDITEGKPSLRKVSQGDSVPTRRSSMRKIKGSSTFKI